MKAKAILFGAAGGGQRLYEKICRKYQIICFVDNDREKWGQTLFDICIKEPQKAILEETYDEIIVTSAPGCSSICEQLSAYGVAKDSINTTYVDMPLKSREQFLKSLATIMKQNAIQGECAEVGVFQGDFAKVINEEFETKKLYLFDTFEGFTQEDVIIETRYQFSNSKISDYSNSSVGLVMKKMKNPENCIVRKGYFPETALDIKEKFCFVNLDVDLYNPTLQGLHFFYNKMTKGGVILIHDYFSENFKGPKEAVDNFMNMFRDKGFQMLPIGDGISVMIVGF